MLNYNSADHYWVVDNDTANVYSSKQGVYVATDDTLYIDWISSGRIPTKIDKNGILLLRIQFLEEKQTIRRMREALTGSDGGWMQDIETKISTLRAQLTK